MSYHHIWEESTKRKQHGRVMENSYRNSSRRGKYIQNVNTDWFVIRTLVDSRNIKAGVKQVHNYTTINVVILHKAQY